MYLLLATCMELKWNYEYSLLINELVISTYKITELNKLFYV